MELINREADADAELFAVDPELAKELGYEPPKPVTKEYKGLRGLFTEILNPGIQTPFKSTPLYPGKIWSDEDGTFVMKHGEVKGKDDPNSN